MSLNSSLLQAMDKKKIAAKTDQTNGKRKEGIKTVKSNTLTVAIAPSDYEHIYAAEKAPVVVPQKITTIHDGVNAIKSESPTMAIAPSDFEHIYAVEKAPQIPGGKKIQAVQAMKSETPTVAIAPSDFEHIYAASKTPVSPKNLRPTIDNEVKPIKSDTPTAAIAPSDYEHIYAANKMPVVAPKAPEPVKESQPVKTVKSNTLTVAIAPSDYEHIYIGDKSPIKATKVTQDNQGGLARTSDTPTIAFAPSDFEHIYTTNTVGKCGEQQKMPKKLTFEKEKTKAKVTKFTPKTVTTSPDYQREASVKPLEFGAKQKTTGISPEVLQVVARFARAQARLPTTQDPKKEQKYKK